MNKFNPGDIVVSHESTSFYTKNEVFVVVDIPAAGMIKIKRFNKEPFKHSTHDYGQYFKAMGCNFEVVGKTTTKDIYSILDKTEKKYLSNIIRPFKKHVEYIEKRRHENFLGEVYEYIKIGYFQNTDTYAIILPDFEVNQMYSGMELSKAYTLKELEL